MTMHPYLAYELARSREDEVRRLAIRHQRRLSAQSRQHATRRFRSWAIKAPRPRPRSALAR